MREAKEAMVRGGTQSAPPPTEVSGKNTSGGRGNGASSGSVAVVGGPDTYGNQSMKRQRDTKKVGKRKNKGEEKKVRGGRGAGKTKEKGNGKDRGTTTDVVLAKGGEDATVVDDMNVQNGSIRARGGTESAPGRGATVVRARAQGRRRGQEKGSQAAVKKKKIDVKVKEKRKGKGRTAENGKEGGMKEYTKDSNKEEEEEEEEDGAGAETQGTPGATTGTQERGRSHSEGGGGRHVEAQQPERAASEDGTQSTGGGTGSPRPTPQLRFLTSPPDLAHTTAGKLIWKDDCTYSHSLSHSLSPPSTFILYLLTFVSTVYSLICHHSSPNVIVSFPSRVPPHVI